MLLDRAINILSPSFPARLSAVLLLRGFFMRLTPVPLILVVPSVVTRTQFLEHALQVLVIRLRFELQLLHVF